MSWKALNETTSTSTGFSTPKKKSDLSEQTQTFDWLIPQYWSQNLFLKFLQSATVQSRTRNSVTFLLCLLTGCQSSSHAWTVLVLTGGLWCTGYESRGLYIKRRVIVLMGCMKCTSSVYYINNSRSHTFPATLLLLLYVVTGRERYLEQGMLGRHFSVLLLFWV